MDLTTRLPVRPADVGPQPVDLAAGATVGGYTVAGELARGGMGIVYRAHDTGLDRDVAVKVLQEPFRADPAAVRRFLDEGRITGRLQHPGIPAVHQIGTLPDGSPFLAMKLIRGDTLADLLSRPAADRPPVLAVFEKVAEAVGYAHAQGVIHRDLKPANVMVGAFGEVQVMDWGISKQVGRMPGPAVGPGPGASAAGPGEETGDYGPPDGTGEDRTTYGQVVGTPAYMAPEQARGETDRIDARADVFALGGLLVRILTGHPTFAGRTLQALAAARAGNVGPARARLDACAADPALVALAKRCLEPDPDRRPANANEVADAVAGLRAAAEDRARRAELDRARAEARASAERKRRRAQLALAAAVGVLLLGGGAVAWWQAAQARAVRERLDRNAGAVAELLDESEAALRADDADRAAVALGAADRRATEGGADAHAGRLARLQTDLTVVRDLESVDAFRWTWIEGRQPDPNAVAARLAAALARFGVVPGETPADAAGQRVAESPARDRLVAALDYWLLAARTAPVRAVLQAADPDPDRDAFRDAVLAGDRARVRALADRPAVLDQPPGFAAVLGANGAIPAARRVQALRAALARRPTDLVLLMTLGSAYPPNRRDGAEHRLRWFQAAVAVAPRNPAARLNLGNALFDVRDLAGAAAEYEAAVRLDPPVAIAHSNLGLARYHRRDLAGAVAECREAIRLAPDLASAHSNLGLALVARGQVDEAIAAYETAIRLQPEFAWAHDGLGVALARRGQTDRAIAEHRTAIRQDPGYAQAHYNLALVLFETGDRDGAVRECREAIRLDPNHAAAHNNLGVILRMRGDLAGAIAAHREAARLSPTDAEAHDNLGLALGEGRDVHGARAAFERAAHLDPTNLMALVHVGMARSDTGDLDGAAAAFAQALRLAPQHGGARDGLRRTDRLRALLPRLAAVAAGRAAPASPAEALDLAALGGIRGQYALAVRLDRQAFAADPNLAPGARHEAARAAVRAAAGQDAGLATVAVEEWAHWTELAHGWLRADLADLGAQAADSGRGPAVRRRLSGWTIDPALTPVRDADWLAAMPADDRRLWAAFWADVAGLERAVAAGR